MCAQICKYYSCTPWQNKRNADIESYRELQMGGKGDLVFSVQKNMPLFDNL